MKTCPRCRALVNERAPTCPACDERLQPRHVALWIGLVVALIAGVAGWMLTR